ARRLGQPADRTFHPRGPGRAGAAAGGRYAVRSTRRIAGVGHGDRRACRPRRRPHPAGAAATQPVGDRRTGQRHRGGERMTEALEPVLVVIPTYNERENLEPIVKRLHAALPTAQVLVVDDGSPDGTGEIADKLAAADERIHVLHRTEKAGLGAA